MVLTHEQASVAVVLRQALVESRIAEASNVLIDAAALLGTGKALLRGVGALGVTAGLAQPAHGQEAPRHDRGEEPQNDDQLQNRSAGPLSQDPRPPGS